MQVSDLIRYNHVVRGLYFDALTKLPWTDVVADKSLSFDSMCNVLLHLTVVEDRWISYIIPGRFSEWVDPNFDDFKNMNSLKKYLEQTRINTEKYLEKLDRELERQIVIPWGDKPGTCITGGEGSLPHGYGRHDSLRRIVSCALADGFGGALPGFLALQICLISS